MVGDSVVPLASFSSKMLQSMKEHGVHGVNAERKSKVSTL